MASREKKGGGDFVLESRHLVGLFMLLVVIFGVVFTLGYLLGRSQYDSKLRASIVTSADDETPPAPPVAKSKAKSKIDDAPPPNAASDWDFYHSAEPKKTEDHLQPPPKIVAAKPAPATAKPTSIPATPAPPAKASATVSNSSATPLDAPLIPKGKIMLQVAAVTSQGDALALAQVLQQKKLPAFVIPPSTAPGADKFYRVQVGPYVDNKSAMLARNDLEAKGFKSIVKR